MSIVYTIASQPVKSKPPEKEGTVVLILLGSHEIFNIVKLTFNQKINSFKKKYSDMFTSLYDFITTNKIFNLTFTNNVNFKCNTYSRV